MRFQEIAEKVKDGSIVLDTQGHNINPLRFIEDCDDTVALANGSNDGNWRNVSDAQMRSHYQLLLDKQVQEGDEVKENWASDGVFCFNCGRHLKWVFDGDRLTLRGYFDPEKREHLKVPLDTLCELHEPRPLTGSINVQSPLIFANIFRIVDDCPKDKKYTEDWSLNAIRGRINVTKYKADQNVACGQMGNMSVGIYTHPNDSTSIIMGCCYKQDQIFDNMSQEEYNDLTEDQKEEYGLIEGHEKIGELCLDVWRWEAADLNTIGDTRYKEVKSKQDTVKLNVPHGTWDFEHYYDFPDYEKLSGSEFIYSRFKLREENNDQTV